METGWYIQTESGGIDGPLSGAMLKTRADLGIVKPDTPVRKGPEGKWAAASRVKGLFGAALATTTPKPQLDESDVASWLQDESSMPRVEAKCAPIAQPPRQAAAAPPLDQNSTMRQHGSEPVHRKTPIWVWLVVGLGVAFVTGIIGALISENSTLRQEHLEAANREMTRAVDDTRAWIQQGKLDGEEQIQQQLRTAQSNPVAAENSLLTATIADFEKARAERQANARKARADFQAATDAIGRGQLDEARRCLSGYLTNEQATEKDRAKALLAEIDLATSESNARKTLLGMSDSRLAKFQETGVLDGEQLANRALMELRNATLKRCLLEIVKERNEKKQRLEAEKQRAEEEQRRLESEKVAAEERLREKARSEGRAKRRSFSEIREKVEAAMKHSAALLPDFTRLDDEYSEGAQAANRVRASFFGSSQEAQSPKLARASFYKVFGFCKPGWEDRPTLLKEGWTKESASKRAAMDIMCNNCEFLMAWEKEDPDMKTYFDSRWKPGILDFNCACALRILHEYGENRIFAGLPYDDMATDAEKRLEQKFIANGWKKISFDEAAGRYQKTMEDELKKW